MSQRDRGGGRGDARDPRDHRDPRDVRDIREDQESRDRESDPRVLANIGDSRDRRDPREIRDSREDQESRDSESDPRVLAYLGDQVRHDRARYDDQYQRDARERLVRVVTDPRQSSLQSGTQDDRQQSVLFPNEGREYVRGTDSQSSWSTQYSRDSRSSRSTQYSSDSRQSRSTQYSRDSDSSRPTQYSNDSRQSRSTQDSIDSRQIARESSLHRDYFLPGDDINREVISYEICRYLGNDAIVRPYRHPDGRHGYLITAYRAPTTVSNTYLVERRQRPFV
jgi:hypothetical protein